MRGARSKILLYSVAIVHAFMTGLGGRENEE